MGATRCVLQPYSGNGFSSLLDECLVFTHNAIQYGEENLVSRRGMKGFYQTLKHERIPSCYKVAAIKRACAVDRSRRKSERKMAETKHRKTSEADGLHRQRVLHHSEGEALRPLGATGTST